MALNESDRDDLYSELTSCTSRWELSSKSDEENILVGIRKDDRLSLFFGPDPVYHYNADNQLRRAYVDGRLYRSQGNTLAQLRRVRTDQETTLQRHDLNEAELTVFLETMREQLRHFAKSLDASSYTVIREKSVGEHSLDLIKKRVQATLQSPVALAPPFPTRKH